MNSSTNPNSAPDADILIVDDEIPNLRLLTELLEKEGYRVRPAESAQLALDSALAQAPSLILLDVRMSDMDGFEVCRRLKRDKRTRDVPIIFVSSLQDSEARVQGFTAGGVDFISKPFQELEILARVRTHIHLHRMQRHLEQLVDERTAQLQESEERFRNLMEQSPLAIAVFTPEGQITKVNTAWMREWDLDEEERDQVLARYNMRTDKQAEDLGVAPLVERAFAGESVVLPPIEYSGNRAVSEMGLEGIEARSRWVQCHLYSVKDENGGVACVVCINADITEQKESEERLRNSEQQYKTLISNIPDVTWTTDRDGRTVFISSNVPDVYGYSPEEVYTRPVELWFDRIHPEDVEGVKRAFQELFEAGTRFDIEYRIRKKNGDWIWLHDRSVATYQKDGMAYADGIFNDVTERRQAQQERDRILLLSRDLICVADMDGCIRYVNPAWECFLGYAKDELMSRFILDFVHPDDRDRSVQQIASLAAGHPSFDFDNRCVCKDGSIRHISWMSTPLVQEKLIHCVGRDITARRQAEEKLRQSEEHFRNLMEQSPLAMAIFTPEGQFTDVNPAWYRQWGLNREEAAEVFARYNHRTDKQLEDLGVAALVERAYAGESVVLPPIEYFGNRALDEMGVEDVEASSCWIRIHLYPVKDENGNVACVVNTNMDITERKRVEDALRVNERRLSLIYESVAEVLFYVSVEPEDCFRFVSVNPAFVKATGIAEDQIVGKRIEEVIPENSLQLVLDNYRESIKANKTVRWEETSAYPTGEKTGIVSIAPVCDENGICTHLVGSVHDMTEHKQADEQMNQMRSELVHATRTGTMGEMTAALAHELNHPLGSILNNANAARRFLEQDNPDLDEIREIISDIISEDRRANEVMQKVRNLMKNTEVGFAPAQINDIIEEVVKLTHSEFVIENVSLSTQLGQDLPQIAGERIQLQQVFINLIMNAIDAMRGGKTKALHISSAQKDADTIVICISDTGVGFSDEKKDKLFKPFFTTKKEGMGMGLSVTRTIVKSHGGEICADNNQDVGASFYIALPVATGRQQA